MVDSNKERSLTNLENGGKRDHWPGNLMRSTYVSIQRTVQWALRELSGGKWQNHYKVALMIIKMVTSGGFRQKQAVITCYWWRCKHPTDNYEKPHWFWAMWVRWSSWNVWPWLDLSLVKVLQLIYQLNAHKPSPQSDDLHSNAHSTMYALKAFFSGYGNKMSQGM